MTFNVRTLSTHEKLLELWEAVKNIHFDVMGICEVRRLGCVIEEYEQFILCTMGTTPGKHGVGFIVKKQYKNNIHRFIGLNERIALLTLNIGNLQIDIIQVYAPTSSADDSDITLFYDALKGALELAGKHIIIIGDFNAKIGQPKPEEYLVTKCHGYGTRNVRGETLIQFAYENKLSILNTFFKKRNNRRWTWRSPDGDTKNEIDYILSNHPNWFQNIEVINTIYPSDHRPVRGIINLQCNRKSRVNYNKLPKSLLKTENEIKTYTDTISSFKKDLDYDDNTTVQSYHDKIIHAITQSLEKAQQARRHDPQSTTIITL
ncbi:craniofacial development protein 2-like [Leguminivora glycinivorella]|uniref:craniofacial development protein 2-like n=1 Tax=Leguminivora glycinivorella TaxID=1035111 RepID=UPI00200DA0C7|nr:craniofacial development protein 2-like [Leguminivora glycinivorella]